MKNAEFHLALPCEDLEKTKDFYINKLNAKLGRSTDHWLDVNLCGNQITFTKTGDFSFDFKNYRLGESNITIFSLWGYRRYRNLGEVVFKFIFYGY